VSDLTINWPWPSWPWQAEASARFFEGIAGPVLRNFVWVLARQIGKTALLSSIILKQSIEEPDEYAYFAPSYDRSEQVYEKACFALRELIAAKLASPRKTAAGWEIRWSKELVGGSTTLAVTYFKSLGNAEMLRGMTLRGAAVDECGLCEGGVWRKIIAPMCKAKDAWKIFSGTPSLYEDAPDADWFKGLWARAQSGDPAYWGIHRDFTAHPSAKFRADTEADRAHTPDDEFRTEHLAEWPDELEYRLPQYIPYDVTPADLQWIGTGIDLADSEQEMGDRASVVTWGVRPGGDVYVLGGEYYRNPSEVLDALYAHRARWHPDVMKLQKTAFDRGFRYTVEQAEVTRGYLPIEMIDIGGASKRRRIMQLEPIAREGKLYVPSDFRELGLEWERFPDGLAFRHDERHSGKRRANHYDMLDALSGCVTDSRDFSVVAATSLMRYDSVDAILRAAAAKAKGIPVERFYRP